MLIAFHLPQEKTPTNKFTIYVGSEAQNAATSRIHAQLCTTSGVDQRHQSFMKRRQSRWGSPCKTLAYKPFLGSACCPSTDLQHTL